MLSCTIQSHLLMKRKCTQKDCHCQASDAASMPSQPGNAMQHTSLSHCCRAQWGIPPVGQRSVLWVCHVTVELRGGSTLGLGSQGLHPPPGQALLKEAEDEEAYAGDCIPAGQGLSSAHIGHERMGFWLSRDSKGLPGASSVAGPYCCCQCTDADCISTSMQHQLPQPAVHNSRSWPFSS